eukprot:TRINITY_DN8224_c0_g1_i2.p1 TRINITY_DN8224_c0_g1~~TRINITY_DN8224_c0_g1_i2.p1  ORF type:complete len:831 (+),score=271.44 TRINITY_DN8224_c0_g1_i2:43-2535(+)
MACMGFDIGYQTSTFAVPKAGGIEVLLNDYSRRQTPTMVAFGDKQRQLGEGAKSKAITSFKNTVTYFKNLIGRQYKHPEVQAELTRAHARHVEMPDGTVGFVVNHGGEEMTLSVKQIMAAHLAHLKSCVDVSLESKVVDTVVGVPVYFNDAQRHAMLDACKIAGLNCLRLMNETSAVALAYGIYKKDLPTDTDKPRRVVFFDFGHSALQLSCADLTKDKLSIVATASSAVGGRDFDLALRDYMVEEFKNKSKQDISKAARPLLKVEAECEKLKKQMSANTQKLPVNIECLYDDRDLHSSMDRETFETMCSDIIERVRGAVTAFAETLKAKDVDIADIFSVEVVGGSCRIPAIKRILQEVFGKEPSTTLNCDEAVARGCALMAAMESPTIHVRDYKVKDSTPFAVTWEWTSPEGSDGSQELIKANSPTGITKVATFQCRNDLTLTVRYSNPETVTDNMASIGSFVVQGVKPSFDDEKQDVKVSARLDNSGCFVVQEATLIERLPQPEAEEPVTPAEGDEAMDTGADKQDGAKATEPEAESEASATEKEEAKDDAKDKDVKEPKSKKPKTHRKTKLTVVSQKPHVLDEKTLNELVEVELQFKLQDQREKEKNDARNALEEYIYDMRDKLTSIYEDFIKPADNDAFRSTLTTMEDWLYEDGEDQPKKVYVEKLQNLQTTGNAVKQRAAEHQSRPEAVEAFQKYIVQVQKFLTEHAAGDEKYDHISQDDIAKVQKELDTQSSFLNEKLAEQGKLSKADEPALTTAAVKAAHSTLERACRPIMNKPKPKAEPPKEEPVTKEGEKAEGEEGSAGQDATPAEEQSKEEKPQEGMDLD